MLIPTSANEPKREEATEEAIPRGNKHILLADDEPAIVKLYQSMLEHLGYTVSSRTSSLETLEAFRARPTRHDILITDQTMPHLTGEMLARAIREALDGKK